MPRTESPPEPVGVMDARPTAVQQAVARRLLVAGDANGRLGEWPAADWQVAEANDSSAVRTRLSSLAADAVVVRIRRAEDVELLLEARRVRPQAARIALVPDDRHRLGLRLVGVAHQVIPYGAPPDELRRVVERTLELRLRLQTPELQSLIAGRKRLPSLPRLYAEVVELAADPTATLAQIGSVIESDVAMSAKVLQVINSSFFGIRHRITDVRQAVTLLGIDTLAALVLSVGIFETARSPQTVEVVGRVQRRALAVGAAVRQIAVARHRPRHELADHQLAGMLHDIGKLILAGEDPRLLAEAEAEPDVLEAERASFGADHQDVGAALLALWGLPDSIVESAAFHHTPASAPAGPVGPLAAVHVTAAVAEADGAEPAIDAHYLQGIGVLGLVDGWISAVEVALDEL